MEEVPLVRSLELNGLDTVAGRAIFQDVAKTQNGSFQGTEEDWSNLVSFYSGNPLALEIVARHILRRYDGNLSEFLSHDLMVFGEIRSRSVRTNKYAIAKKAIALTYNIWKCQTKKGWH